MMKNLKTIRKVIALCMLLLPLVINAQQASMTIVGLSGQNMTVAGSTIYLPAGAYLNHTGNLYFGVNQFIAGNTGTTITGITGSRLHLLSANQLDASAPATTTQMDVNGLSIGVDASLYNPQNLSLNDQAFGAATGGNGANAIFLREFAFATIHPFTGSAITDNHVITNANRFVIGPTGTISGYDVNRYVVTNDNAGELRKLGLNTGSNFFFPIGRAESDYTPARMQVVSGGPVDYYMNVRNFAESIPDETIGGYSSMPNVSRTWTSYASNANTVAAMDFIHLGTPLYEVNGYSHNNSNVIRFSGNGWTPNLLNDAENESLYGTPANYWAQQINFAVPAAVGANSFYGKSNSLSILPVRFGDFTVTARDCEAQLGWTTLSEQNLSHFVVQRSYNGRDAWEAIGKVTAIGNSSTLRQYNAADTKSIGGEAFYRLALVENDGRIMYSATRFVRFNCTTKITGYPNPARETFTILLPRGVDKYAIQLTNAAGQLVMPVTNRSAGSATVQIAHLPAGIYNFTITDTNGKVANLRMMKN